MKKIITVGVVSLVVVSVVVGDYFWYNMGKQHDYRNAKKDVYVPVLVIHAADDLQSEAASRLYADTFPNASFEIIQNSGHFPFHEQPVRFAQVVGQFLNRLD